MLKGGIVAAIVGAAFVLAGVWVGFAVSRPEAAAAPVAPALPGVPIAVPGPPHPSFDPLQASVVQLIQASGGTGAVTLTELGGHDPKTWSYDGDQPFTAASTYKLPLLMEEAQNVAAGRWHGRDRLCYQDSDQEDGWYTDYDDGVCFSRSQLELRVGQKSDNTAAHILVRYDGGSAALNSYAKAHGAKESAFFVPNTTTSSDLGRLWASEVGGKAGGQGAQQYLYPMLTNTAFEDGIPAGVPKGTKVVHKIGDVDDVVNDAALVTAGPSGAYVLVVCTEGVGGDPGWKLVADISRAVWRYESTR